MISKRAAPNVTMRSQTSELIEPPPPVTIMAFLHNGFKPRIVDLLARTQK